jgi:hypothetical protein
VPDRRKSELDVHSASITNFGGGSRCSLPSAHATSQPMFDCNELSLQRRASRQRLQCIGSLIVESERAVSSMMYCRCQSAATLEAVKAPDETDGMIIKVLAHFEIRINEFLQ